MRNTVAVSGAPKPIRFHREVILLVDDDPNVRRALARGLEREGYIVHAAENGLDALGFALWPDHKVDLVVTDIIMPVVDGREFVDHLYEAHPEMPVVFVSGHPCHTLDWGGAAAKANARFLMKPFNLNELTTNVRALLDDSASRRRRSNFEALESHSPVS